MKRVVTHVLTGLRVVVCLAVVVMWVRSYFKEDGVQVSKQSMKGLWHGEVNHEHYRTRDQARASIFEYIEVFYNRTRLHSSIGYLSPEQFEAGLN
jgi:transposase InsO family protein